MNCFNVDTLSFFYGPVTREAIGRGCYVILRLPGQSVKWDNDDVCGYNDLVKIPLCYLTMKMTIFPVDHMYQEIRTAFLVESE